MSDDKINYDIVIVGAGMVGAAMACALGKVARSQKLSIAVIESHPFTLPDLSEKFDPRVVAMTIKSQQFFQTLDVWDAISAHRISPYTQMQVWDADGTGAIDFDCAEIQQPVLGHIVENSFIVHELVKKVQTSAAIELLCPAKVAAISCAGGDKPGIKLEENQAQIILEDGRILESSLVIAADGALSKVRELAGFTTREWDYQHTAIVTSVETQKEHQQVARQRFMTQGPLAFLPLQTASGDQHHCSIVWSTQKDHAEQLMAMDNDAFQQALGQAFEYRLGDVVGVDKRFCFPLRQRHATDYIHPGIVLIGDAAHTIHPLAGQGANLGLLDAMTLTEEIERGLSRGLDAGDGSILRRYQRRRKASNLSMMLAMEGFKRLFAKENLPLRWLRNTGMSQLNAMPLIKHRIMRSAMGV